MRGERIERTGIDGQLPASLQEPRKGTARCSGLQIRSWLRTSALHVGLAS